MTERVGEVETQRLVGFCVFWALELARDPAVAGLPLSEQVHAFAERRHMSERTVWRRIGSTRRALPELGPEAVPGPFGERLLAAVEEVDAQRPPAGAPRAAA